MKLKRREAWICCRLIGGRVPVAPGSVEPLIESERIAGLTAMLRQVDPRQRAIAWMAFLAGRPDRAGWEKPVSEADPNGPPPPEDDPEDIEPVATLADLKKVVVDTSWPWPGWLVGGALNTLASNPGVGKTILAMNLARSLWLGRPWPDGSANPFATGTKTLWIPGDRHYSQLIDLAEKYGLPGEAMLFNAPPDEPTSGLNLDDPESLTRLESAIDRHRPGLVIVDTVGGTTTRNRGLSDEANTYFGPLQDIASLGRTAFLMLTHLSKDNNAPLGRRIVGASRAVWLLSRPDAEAQPDRRKLWVDKSSGAIPPALGMTIAEGGCTFDGRPPEEPRVPGPRPATRQKECQDWLKEFLGGEARRASDVWAAAQGEGFSKDTYYTARKALGLQEFHRERAKYLGVPQATAPEPELF